MAMNNISFHNEGVTTKTPSKRLLKAWIKEFVSNHGKKIGELAFIFCSDEKILEVNQNFLQHDYYTDIITFDYCEDEIVSGDIFISVERVKENAYFHNVEYKEELLRVLAHGVLHLIGFQDKSTKKKKEMTENEDLCISLFLTKFAQ
ncbi:MAG: rRNA maturation RNase YbeY [Bacteroidota bacterium]